jgi:hypothetical protein
MLISACTSSSLQVIFQLMTRGQRREYLEHLTWMPSDKIRTITYLWERMVVLEWKEYDKPFIKILRQQIARLSLLLGLDEAKADRIPIAGLHQLLLR